MLFTPENLDTISTGRVSGIHTSDYGGSWKNSFIFYVNVDSEWKGTSRICFRIQRCAWSDSNEFCGGAVHRTLEPEAPLVPLTESFTPEFLARRWVEHSFGAASSSCHLVLGIVRDWTSGRVLAILLLSHQGDGRANSPQGCGETMQWLPCG